MRTAQDNEKIATVVSTNKEMRVYDTECTCRERRPIEVIYQGRTVIACQQCGSLK